jgi:phosphate:Na+ symporter
MVELGEVLIGFGILFAGMQSMESAVKSLSSLPEFKQVFLMFTNPVVGVLIGAAITGIIQSSSASVGILQAFATSVLLLFLQPHPLLWDKI